MSTSRSVLVASLVLAVAWGITCGDESPPDSASSSSGGVVVDPFPDAGKKTADCYYCGGDDECLSGSCQNQTCYGGENGECISVSDCRNAAPGFTESCYVAAGKVKGICVCNQIPDAGSDSGVSEDASSGGGASENPHSIVLGINITQPPQPGLSGFSAAQAVVNDITQYTVTSVVAAPGISVLTFVGNLLAPQVNESAGVVTITGTTMPITLTPDPTTKVYPGFYSSQAVAMPGDAITFSWAGADVPAGTAMATVPTQVIITSPSQPVSPAPLVIDRTQPFTLTWTDGVEGDVVVLLSDGGTATTVHQIIATFPATAGSGVLPVAALAKLMATTMGSLDVSVRSAATITDGEYSGTATARGVVTAADGTEVFAGEPVTLQ